MTTPEHIVDWVFDAIDKLGGRADFVKVAEEIWNRHEPELRDAGELFFIWQTIVRRVAPWLEDPERSRSEKRRFDAFISHASADLDLAKHLEAGLEARGLSIWLDDSDIRLL